MWRSIGSVFSGSKNTGAIAETAKIDTASETTKNSSGSETNAVNYNAIVHGVGGSAAATTTHDGVFYAYMHTITDDNVYRLVLIFASSDVADEWWRAVSTSTITILVNNIQRVTPQFYTQNINIWNFYNFFIDTRLTTLADTFRGNLFFVLENDRVGRGISIIPRQAYVDTTSGNWFSIRSKIYPNQHWYYDEGLGCILASETKRTLFRISAPDMHDGAIMIGSDDVTLVAQHHGFVVPVDSSSSVASVLGVTGEQTQAFKFKFKDLKEGKFIPGTDSIPSPLCYVPQGGAGTGWVLA